MINRILWIIILSVFILAWYLYYEYNYKNILIENNSNIDTENEWLKEISLAKLEKEETNLTNTQKIELLKKYRSFNLWNKQVYFEENNWKIELYINEKYISSFEKIDKNQINLMEIYWSFNDLYFAIWDKKYIYNSSLWRINEFVLNININYIKKSENKYLINTEKWTFIYDFYKKEINYFSIFNDFVFYNWLVIWIIKNDEEIIKNNFWFDNENDNLIVYFNQETKDKMILLKTSENINKIYNSDDKIYFLDEENNEYLLENYN